MRVVTDADGKPHLLLNPVAVRYLIVAGKTQQVREAAAAWLQAYDAALWQGAEVNAACIAGAAAWDSSRRTVASCQPD